MCIYKGTYCLKGGSNLRLYHYTSEAGFIGMVLDRRIRLTQSTQSNDSKDTIYIHDLINANKEEFILNDNMRDNKVIDIILDAFGKFSYERFVEGDQERSNKAFVVCFTDKADNRMLWTSYTNDNGYCIGIDYKGLNNLMQGIDFERADNRLANYALLSGVIYDQNSQKSLIKSILKEEYGRFSVLPDDRFSENIPAIIYPYQLSFANEKGDILYKGEKQVLQLKIRQKFELMARSVIDNLLLVSPIIKHDYWEDEKETRLVLYRPVINDSFVNVGVDNMGRNYIEITAAQDIFNEVVIAPNNSKTVDMVKRELLSAGYDESKIIVKYSSGKGIVRERGK